jgi:hypothetical protein
VLVELGVLYLSDDELMGVEESLLMVWSPPILMNLAASPTVSFFGLSPCIAFIPFSSSRIATSLSNGVFEMSPQSTVVAQLLKGSKSWSILPGIISLYSTCSARDLLPATSRTQSPGSGSGSVGTKSRPRSIGNSKVKRVTYNSDIKKATVLAVCAINEWEMSKCPDAAKETFIAFVIKLWG